MTHPPRCCAYVFVTISLFGFISVAQQPRVLAPHRQIAPRVEKPIKWLAPAAQRSMVGGLWMTDANFKASIYLRNIVETDSIAVTPSLYLSNGKKYELPQVTVEPAGIVIVNINDELQKLGISSWATLSGYVELNYTWPWDPFCATVRNVDTAHSLIFTYPLRPTAAPPIQANIVGLVVPPPTHKAEGMWWKQEGNVSAFVAIENLSAQAVRASVEVTDSEANAFGEHDVTISPHGMKTVTLDELRSAPALQGGVRIISSTTTDQLGIYGGLEDPAVGYSAAMPFATQAVNPSVGPSPATFGEIGLMAGAADPMMLFPAGTTFAPYSVLHNISDATVAITPTLWWMEAGQPRSAQLSPVTLQPYQTQALDMKSLLVAFGPKNFNGTFNLVFDGLFRRDAILMSSGSVDQTNSYVFEVVARGIADSGARSLQYWSTANGDDTMVTVWNPADEPQDFAFSLFFKGGHYTLPLHLGPRVTRAFDVSAILQSQVPDRDGNIIPAGVLEGTLKISGIHAENEHILVAIDSGIYNVRKATCGNNCQECDGFSVFGIIDNPFAVAVSATHQLSAMATWNTGSQYNYTNNSGWTTSNAPVATVGLNTNGGKVSGVSAGTATMSDFLSNEPVGAGWVCSGPGYWCPSQNYSAGSPGSVARLYCTTPVARGSSTTCTVTPSSGVTVSNWTFRDANGVVVARSQGTGNLTWNGAMVISGTVSVSASAFGAIVPLSATIAVTSRTTFSFTAVSASKRTNPYQAGNCNISVPLSPAAGNLLGYFCVDQWFHDVSAQVNDNGPNQGYRYVASATNADSFPTTFNYITAAYLDNSQSAFSQHQCGNYNAQTNTGYISQTQLLSNTVEHESGIIRGHYVQYKSAQDDPANNVGIAAEGQVGAPGLTDPQFQSQVLSAAQSKGSAIATAAAVEACNHDVRLDTSCIFRGYINWPTYATCP